MGRLTPQGEAARLQRRVVALRVGWRHEPGPFSGVARHSEAEAEAPARCRLPPEAGLDAKPSQIKRAFQLGACAEGKARRSEPGESAWNEACSCGRSAGGRLRASHVGPAHSAASRAPPCARLRQRARAERRAPTAASRASRRPAGVAGLLRSALVPNAAQIVATTLGSFLSFLTSLSPCELSASRDLPNALPARTSIVPPRQAFRLSLPTSQM